MYTQYRPVFQTKISANVHYVPIRQTYCSPNIPRTWYIYIYIYIYVYTYSYVYGLIHFHLHCLFRVHLPVVLNRMSNNPNYDKTLSGKRSEEISRDHGKSITYICKELSII